jgi:hypothetical protein
MIQIWSYADGFDKKYVETSNKINNKLEELQKKGYEIKSVNTSTAAVLLPNRSTVTKYALWTIVYDTLSDK